MTDARQFAQSNAQRFEEELKDFIRIPSVSTLPENSPDILRAAEWLAAELTRVGMETVEVVKTNGHPIVYAEWLGAGEDAPTLLIYGHYDVQPAEKSDGWQTEPFDPVVKDGKLYARGSTDDKGQVYTHVKAAEAYLAAEGKLPINLKFVVEGEEETSSIHLQEFIINNRERLRADVSVISDSSILAKDKPSIVYSVRGLIYTELHITGPSVDLHSGGFGGTVHNPIQALTEIIAQLHNPDGSVNVPGFYDDVLILTPEEREDTAKTSWTEEYWKEVTGAPQPWGEPEYNFRERIGARPTLEINGILGGFTGPGAKTVLPSKAMAKISCRLVSNQDANKIYELLRDHIANITPPTVTSELRLLHSAEPAIVDIHHPAMNAAKIAYQRGWGGETPVFVREGGTLPVVIDLQQQLNVPVVLMGYGLDTDGAHGPDEHFDLEMFHKGIATSIEFYRALAENK